MRDRKPGRKSGFKKMINENLSFIIPTLNRTDYLRRFLASIKRQGVLPGELIIVDGGPRDISSSLRDFNRMNIRYFNTGVPSLTKQRNTGIANLGRHAGLVGFVDDDIVFEENSLKNMMDFWETAGADIGGASFNNITSSFTGPNIIDRIFCIKGTRGGELLRSGFNTHLSLIDATRRVDWLFGGITIWRRRVTEEFKFDEWFTGNAFCDDIDYSYRVGKRYKMMVIKEALVSHLGQPPNLAREYQAGKNQTANRIYFVQKHKEFSKLLCYWSHLGLSLKNLFRGILRLKPRYILRSIGIFAGLLQSFRTPYLPGQQCRL